MITHAMDYETETFPLNGIEITKETAAHKYCGDPMAEYLDMMDCDEQTGDVEWDTHIRRFGKRLLFCDDRGFVWVKKLATQEEATALFDMLDSEYAEWDDQDDY